MSIKNVVFKSTDGYTLIIEQNKRTVNTTYDEGEKYILIGPDGKKQDATAFLKANGIDRVNYGSSFEALGRALNYIDKIKTGINTLDEDKAYDNMDAAEEMFKEEEGIAFNPYYLDKQDHDFMVNEFGQRFSGVKTIKELVEKIHVQKNNADQLGEEKFFKSYVSATVDLFSTQRKNEFDVQLAGNNYDGALQTYQDMLVLQPQYEDAPNYTTERYHEVIGQMKAQLAEVYPAIQNNTEIKMETRAGYYEALADGEGITPSDGLLTYYGDQAFASADLGDYGEMDKWIKKAEALEADAKALNELKETAQKKFYAKTVENYNGEINEDWQFDAMSYVDGAEPNQKASLAQEAIKKLTTSYAAKVQVAAQSGDIEKIKEILVDLDYKLGTMTGLFIGSNYITIDEASTVISSDLHRPDFDTEEATLLYLVQNLVESSFPNIQRNYGEANNLTFATSVLMQDAILQAYQNKADQLVSKLNEAAKTGDFEEAQKTISELNKLPYTVKTNLTKEALETSYNTALANAPRYYLDQALEAAKEGKVATMGDWLEKAEASGVSKREVRQIERLGFGNYRKSH